MRAARPRWTNTEPRSAPDRLTRSAPPYLDFHLEPRSIRWLACPRIDRQDARHDDLEPLALQTRYRFVAVLTGLSDRAQETPWHSREPSASAFKLHACRR